MKSVAIEFTHIPFTNSWYCLSTRYASGRELTAAGADPASALLRWLSLNRDELNGDLNAPETPSNSPTATVVFEFHNHEGIGSGLGYHCITEGYDGADDSNHYIGMGVMRSEALDSWIDSEMDLLNELVDPQSEQVA